MIKTAKVANIMVNTGTSAIPAAADAFCTSREAARLLDVSVKTAQLWAESGVLQAWKTPGGHRRITRRSVDELLAQRRQVLGDAAEISPVAAPPRHRLLIVENEARSRRLYELTLSHWGLPLEVTLARDGFEALLLIGDLRPDTIVTDLDMPGMDGFRLVSALRADRRCQATHIVVVSAMTPAQVRAGGGLPKSVNLLAKPIPFNQLRKIVEQHLLG
jgi:excisionase family DNA binding protein